jgi:enoyl-CoA hydratase/carnithine racemase
VTDITRFGDVEVTIGDRHVARVEIQRPPHNYFDLALIADLASAVESLDADPRCRAIVLSAAGKNFCAGAQLGGGRSAASAAGARTPEGPVRHLYDEAVRLFATRTPIVAAIQGAAIGGGLGLALMPDFRVASPAARFAANFARLGFHHGFGLSVTLPQLVGRQRAMDLLYTGRRVGAEEALQIGLVDRLSSPEELLETAHEMAREIAISAPLAVASIRETLRGDMAERIRIATDRERAEQERLQKTDDMKEGVRAMAERREPAFVGR